MRKPFDVSVVVIGRNEGARLLRCFDSIHAAKWGELNYELIYVDSRSDDQSIANALEHNAKSIELVDGQLCAARARNQGLECARGTYVLFLDGDTVLDADFPQLSITHLEAEEKVCAVWGHRRELHPENSIYNRVLDLDWVYREGLVAYCGGDVMFRRDALEQVKGFNEAMIAGEEPEMCRRLREKGWLIRHIDAPMTKHDLDIRRFKQYWRRADRAGYAYALVADLFADTPDPLWLDQMRKNYIHAGVLVVWMLMVVTGLIAGFAWLSGLLILGALAVLARSTKRNLWKSQSYKLGFLYAMHSQFQKLPIAWGQLTFWWAKRQGARRTLIEYKA